MQWGFRGKLLWLTGANGLIAREIAATFYRLGASCLLTDVDLEGLEQFCDALDPARDRLLCFRQDVGSSEDANRVAEAIKTRFDGLDFVVTAAGLYRERTIAEMTDADWRTSAAVNLDGVFFTCRAAAPLFRDQAAIVNIASMAGHRGSHSHAGYAASKGGVLTLTRTLALELAPRVRANAVSPGIIDTPLVRQLMEQQGARITEATPLKRIGLPAEVASAVAFLCSQSASFITGETLHVNGGLHIAS